MATFRVTPATSVVTSANAVYAFSSDSLGADTLIVDPGAFLISTAFNSGGASLANTGGWTVTVNGSIFTHGNQERRRDLGRGWYRNIQRRCAHHHELWHR